MTDSRLMFDCSASLGVYPIPECAGAQDPSSVFTLGDLHGNALKLIYFLIRHNFLKMSPSDYDAFIKIYNKTILEKEDIEAFHAILNRGEFYSAGAIRLIGDEICDRGSNDYFVLKILEKLNQHNINFEIMLSNHGGAGLKVYEDKYAQIDLAPAVSYYNFQSLIERGVIAQNSVIKLMENHYKPMLKLISYEVRQKDNGKSHIEFFTHAAVGRETIKRLANFYNIKYQDKDLKNTNKICKLIDTINAEFQKALAAGQFCQQFNYGSPLYHIAWNRDVFMKNIDVLSEVDADYTCSWVHGHEIVGGVLGASYYNNMLSLDNYFGKCSLEDEKQNQGIVGINQYSVLVSTKIEKRYEQTITVLDEDEKALMEFESVYVNARSQLSRERFQGEIKRNALEVIEMAKRYIKNNNYNNQSLTIESIKFLTNVVSETVNMAAPSCKKETRKRYCELADQAMGAGGYWVAFGRAMAAFALTVVLAATICLSVMSFGIAIGPLAIASTALAKGLTITSSAVTLGFFSDAYRGTNGFKLERNRTGLSRQMAKLTMLR